nr:unnamed protein product [Spirometra erinaceieuropaei]
MRRAVFQALHGLSNPRIRAFQKLLAERFAWPGMNKDVKAWARSCLSCQCSKLQRRNKSSPGTFPSPDARFSHVHLDVVGPLRPSNGFTRLLTSVDRYTRWAEAIPLPNVQAETIVKAFVSRWVAMFGAPYTVTTDRGAQFESALIQTQLNFLGCTRIRTTAYHPAANDMVERFHRQLKTALRVKEDPRNWSDNLPLALLGIRAALKSDLGCSAAELVFGTTLRLAGEMIIPTSRGADDTPDNFVHSLRQFMRSLSPVPPRTPMTESYVGKDLDKCTHVFVWCDRVRQPLESPYEGPFRVLARNAKTCWILRGDKEDVVIVNRVKAAVAEEPPDLSQGQKCADPLTPVPPSSLFTAIAFDPPGCGFSTPPVRDWSDPEVLLQDARVGVNLMRQLGHLPFSCIGWSEGALSAIRAASELNMDGSIEGLVVWELEEDIGAEDGSGNGGQIMGGTPGSVDFLPDSRRLPLQAVYGRAYMRDSWPAYVETKEMRRMGPADLRCLPQRLLGMPLLHIASRHSEARRYQDANSQSTESALLACSGCCSTLWPARSDADQKAGWQLPHKLHADFFQSSVENFILKSIH